LTVAVFPFVDGTTASDCSFSDPDWRRLAAMMAALHASEMPGSACPLPRETFANPFAATIRHALQRAASTDAWPSARQRQTAALLRAHRADLEETMARFARLGEQARRLAPSLVPTHGDPNLSNVLLDATGALWLIDWGGLGLGPRERDLFAFTGDRFASFLEAYLARTGPVQLHLDLFAFYSTRWVLQEIADYTSRLLLTPGDAEAQAHAWQELQPYLPVPYAALAADHDAVQRALAPIVRTGLVYLCQSPA
jgi:spectinomycin phosphotransferase